MIGLSKLSKIHLGELKKGQKARITRVGIPQENSEISKVSNIPNIPNIQRLMEMGFLEGALVEIVQEAPFGGDPIAVRVRGALIALRRNEANAIEVSIS